MHRLALDYLLEWKTKATRRPLVSRGARQVGKSHLVLMFAEEHCAKLVELNFWRSPEPVSLFSTDNPQRSVQLLEQQFNVAIHPGSTLVFLDELQGAPARAGARALAVSPARASRSLYLRALLTHYDDRASPLARSLAMEQI